MIKTAVVILNYNGERLLPKFLPSVIEHSKNAAVIVADNASTDQSLKVLESIFPSVPVIKLESNFGFCGGYNRALKQVEAEYYVLLNSDVEVTSNWLNPIIELLDANPTIAAAQPKILSYAQKDHFEYAGAGGGFIDSLGYPFCRGRLFDVTEKDSGQYNDTREIFWATGACMFVRAKTYHELGGLDEDFFAHMEEIDLCWKIQRAGAQVYYCGESHVFHVGAGTLAKSNPRKTYYNFRNGLSLIFKHWSRVALLTKFPLRLLLDYIAAIKFILSGKFADASAIARAHFHFFQSFGQTLNKRRQFCRKYPESNKNTFKGSILLEHFVLRKKIIKVDQ
jgi:GT2 family glycosyltransferase